MHEIFSEQIVEFVQYCELGAAFRCRGGERAMSFGFDELALPQDGENSEEARQTLNWQEVKT